MEFSREKLISDGAMRMLVSPEMADITSDWFDPRFWGTKARSVATGGRGGAWFVNSPEGAVVLRQYRRGGLASRLSGRSYFYTGDERTRSFAEFRLLKELSDMGLPVPDPVAALVQRNGPLTYCASIIIRRIPGAVPLPESESLQEAALWCRVGAMLRRFHDAGLYHADLNCDNILVADDGLFLIDFDKCRMQKASPGPASWKRRNLSRLWRSVRKRCTNLTPESKELVWLAFCQGYGH